MSEVRNWIQEQSKRFVINVEESNQENTFLSTTWKVSDPNEVGLPLEISENSKGNASLIDVPDILDFARLNIAEGFSSRFILSFASSLLEGSFNLEHSGILGRPYIIAKESEQIGTVGRVKLLEYITHCRSINNRLQLAQKGYRQR